MADHREELSPSYSWYIRDWRASRRVQDLSWKERGFYRECLDWSWDLNGLPNEPGIIQDLLQATAADFKKLWPVAHRFYITDDDGRLRNPRQEVERRKQATNKRRASDGGKAKSGLSGPHAPPVSSASSTPASSASSSAGHGAPPLPLPSPLPVPLPVPLQPSSGGGSRRPIFTGQRLVVFEWFLDKAEKILGETHLNAFDIHEWFFTLDAQAVAANAVIPDRDNGEWLAAQLVAEARRRGLPMVVATTETPALGKFSSRMAAMVAKARAEGV